MRKRPSGRRRASFAGRRKKGSTRRLAAHGLAPGFEEEDYRERLDFELGVIESDEISGLLPDRRRLHPMGEGARDSGRAGPRLGRRLGRRLVAHHHRPRSAALRAALRALPQSRPRVDAGFRHRFLPGAPRRGDRLRRASATARDRVAQIITFGTLQARAALRDVGRVLEMPYGQVDRLCKLVPADPGQSGDAGRRRSRASRASRRRASRSRWSTGCSPSR